jgi:hypothetical protein
VSPLFKVILVNLAGIFELLKSLELNNLDKAEASMLVSLEAKLDGNVKDVNPVQPISNPSLSDDKEDEIVKDVNPLQPLNTFEPICSVTVCKFKLVNPEQFLKASLLIATTQLGIDNDVKEEQQGEIRREYIQSQMALRNAHMTWTLNKNVDQEKISVEFKDGILSITLPIIEEKEKEPIVLKIK